MDGLVVQPDDIELFIKDLWKDQRQLELCEQDGQQILKRYGDQHTILSEELCFLKILEEKKPFRIPKVIDCNARYMTFEYIRGTRAFNLFHDLKCLYEHDEESIYMDLARELLNSLKGSLEEFQLLFNQENNAISASDKYPAHQKILTVFQLLINVLNIGVPVSSISDDLFKISRVYSYESRVPFRDATAKNVIVGISELYQKNGEPYSQRLEKVSLAVKSGGLFRAINDAKIYHIDFSGCPYLCPTIDDWIALKHHEATNWLINGEESVFWNPDGTALCAAFVRFLRFGGRKLAYRLLNKDGYRVRFGLDNEKYYFEKLIWITDELKKLGVIDGVALRQVIESIGNSCDITSKKDYIHSYFKLSHPPGYYSDIYPH